MYLRGGYSAYRGGDQVHTRGLFLIFAQPGGIKAPHNAPIRCCVRRVALRQLGQWMMGRVNIGGHWYTVSGAYGSDGLPMHLPEAVYQTLPLELPKHLYDAWNHGGGWNSAGSEAVEVRKWALENLDKLMPTRRKPRFTATTWR